ncbi:MAG: MFS transporter [Janthinobacterium lividum]
MPRSSSPAAAHAVSALPMLSQRRIVLLASVSAANAYYVQPLLVDIGASLHLSTLMVGLLPALTQFGVAAGVLLVMPLGDFVSVRRLFCIAMPMQALALATMAFASNAGVFIVASLIMGFFGIGPYLMPPYVTLRTPLEKRGHVTGMLAQGVVTGILAARAVSGVLGHHFGWRTVYGLAALLMLAAFFLVRRVVQPTVGLPRPAYVSLLMSVVRLVRSEPAIWRSTLCQALNFGAFNALWVGLTFHMQSPVFGWHSDGVGALAFIAALTALAAPFVGQFSDKRGVRQTLLISLSGILLTWVVLAIIGYSVAGILLGLIIFDLCCMAADVSNRSLVYRLHPGIRTRLNTVYTTGMFAGGALFSWLTGICWSLGGWQGVCALGALASILALLVAWWGIGHPVTHHRAATAGQG